MCELVDDQIAALQENFFDGNRTKRSTATRAGKVGFTDATSRTACGPNMHSRDGWAVSNFIQALENESITISGSDHFCYVDDLIDGLTSPDE
ncbi:hypothetical protein NKJ50_28930 [Mesorhizobium sp. M0115]|uniref:hypothetical protein n=1 Tax=unclassified Mesorhizobium TaxID=325217 RepID=UPI00333E17DE